MNCKDALEFISSAHDGELSKEDYMLLKEHLSLCPSCRNEFELDQITKNVIKYKLKRVNTPEEVKLRILAQLTSEKPKYFHTLQSLISLVRFRWRIAVAVGTVAIIFLIILYIPEKQQPFIQLDNGNIIDQSFNTFELLINGSITPQVVSNDYKTVQRFFKQEVDYDINLLQLKNCTLQGGILSRYKDEEIVHVFYLIGNNRITVTQIPIQSIYRDSTFILPIEVKRELDHTGWFLQEHIPGCSMIMWIKDSMLCCAVGDMEQERLLAHFREVCE